MESILQNNPESLSREEVVAKLRENPTDISPLALHLANRQEQLQNGAPEDALNLSVERAEIYEEAGLSVDAFREYFVTCYCARNLGHDELAQKFVSKYQILKDQIWEKIEELRASKNIDAAEALWTKMNEAEDFCDTLD